MAGQMSLTVLVMATILGTIIECAPLFANGSAAQGSGYDHRHPFDQMRMTGVAECGRDSSGGSHTAPMYECMRKQSDAQPTAAEWPCIRAFDLCNKRLDCPHGEDEHPVLCMFFLANQHQVGQLKRAVRALFEVVLQTQNRRVA